MKKFTDKDKSDLIKQINELKKEQQKINTNKSAVKNTRPTTSSSKSINGKPIKKSISDKSINTAKKTIVKKSTVKKSPATATTKKSVASATAKKKVASASAKKRYAKPTAQRSVSNSRTVTNNKPIKKTVNKSVLKRRKSLQVNKKIIVIASSCVALLVLLFCLYKFVGFETIFSVFSKDNSNNDIQNENVNNIETDSVGKKVVDIEEVFGVKTDFVRNQINSNMMLNSKGNFVSIENTEDEFFMDLVFRETTVDGELVNKTIIKSDYTLYTYIGKYCNDWIDVNDGYILAGYAKRGDYAIGGNDINAWIAKIDYSANIIWEKTFDDAYKKGSVLNIEQVDNNYRLFIEYKSLKNGFITVDKTGEVVSYEASNKQVITFDDTDDGGKVLLKERNEQISIIEKTTKDGEVVFDKYINGAYIDIFACEDGYLLFGEKEIDLQPTTVVTLVDESAEIIWEKKVSEYQIPKIKSVKYFEGVGYFLTGYVFNSNGIDGPRQIKSLFDDTIQDIQDAWILKLNEDYTVAWEKTYAYGDMGSMFDNVIQIDNDKYYILGTSQYQGSDAAHVIQNDIITGIIDNSSESDSKFIDIGSSDMVDTPVVNDVCITPINYSITNGGLSDDYAIKVYWANVAGAKNYKVTLFDGSNQIYSVTTNEMNSLVITDILFEHGMLPERQYSVSVSSIDESNNENTSEKKSFIVKSDEYALLRNWTLKYDFDDRSARLFYKTSQGPTISSSKLYRCKMDDNGKVTDEKLISQSSTEQIVDDFRSFSYGKYFYRMEIIENDGKIHTVDSPIFDNKDITEIPYESISLDESKLSDEVGITTSEMETLKEIIFTGNFEYETKSHVKILQKFLNYYFAPLEVIGVYEQDTEPESGFDIPIEVNGYFKEDTNKGAAYMLALFGRTGVDGERIYQYIDGELIEDAANFVKLPVSNDIISANRSYGNGAKYNSGYSFDTSDNLLGDMNFAIPIDHEPLKSTYFGIRYLPYLNGEEYDKGVRLHAGVDYRNEQLIIRDILEAQEKEKQEYIDSDEDVEVSEVEIEEDPNEVRRDRIYSIYDGVVVKIDYSAGNGGHVLVKHVTKDAEKHEFYSQYLHLSSAICEVGQTLKRGEMLGTMGNTGDSQGKHLHQEMFFPEIQSSTFLNPLIFDFSYPPLKEEAIAIEEKDGFDIIEFRD